MRSYACGKLVTGRFLRFQFPNEYEKPVIATKFPGSAHRAAMDLVSATQSVDGAQHMQRFVDIKKSKGVYFADTDGNVVLDFDTPVALGYNND